MDTWLVDQTLDVAAEVYDPKRRNIHELDEDDMLDRFQTLLGFDVNWDQPPTEPTEPTDRRSRLRPTNQRDPVADGEHHAHHP